MLEKEVFKNPAMREGARLALSGTVIAESSSLVVARGLEVLLNGGTITQAAWPILPVGILVGAFFRWESNKPSSSTP